MKYQDWKLGLIEFLLYDSYKFHREQHPELEPSRWVSIFENANKYEELYQKEQRGVTR